MAVLHVCDLCGVTLDVVDNPFKSYSFTVKSIRFNTEVRGQQCVCESCKSMIERAIEGVFKWNEVTKALEGVFEEEEK